MIDYIMSSRGVIFLETSTSLPYKMVHSGNFNKPRTRNGGSLKSVNFFSCISLD